MTLSHAESDQLVRNGLDLLRRGDGASARLVFERLLAEAPDAPRPWFPLAQACRLTRDSEGEANALTALLREEPRHLAGLLFMAERKRLDGDDRAATSFYTAALNQAAAAGEVPASLHPLLHQAEAFKQQAATRFADHLGSAVGPSTSPRVAESLDLLLGRTQLYLQQPSMFYFAGLPQRAFFAREEFDWVAEIEAATPAIRAELEAADAQQSGFTPYVAGSSDRPMPNNPLLDDPAWSALYLWRGGQIVAENATRFPATLAALAALPIPRIAGRSPMALFSRLTPGTHIQPHHGLLNTRLICHLPIIAPDGCALRVGAETRSWREGELMIFDDSFEHEAWNRGTAVRTVLLFEIWRPEIGYHERADLTRLFEAIDAYGPALVDQG
ncbi:aspartyl/asparaginyl beta-hydroxylase domain-containing protein [Sphingomonas radiodurans]|uniref:aspartyl/asparaginyl beta-hydroxylase domain-containing protein n=1 Tax=Sphingomonas radiodurans TaxID=2890321 RepID=UPI001E2B59DD|nr:aspartyl/asparaginyl beta-hydroxylase domain-containing protein [Sphingomonas radiodurans]WBH16673.1 aspartyl/asparaginyl beta-hydroxylase domain-containing protein [Sphingomonas radiodurans]